MSRMEIYYGVFEKSDLDLTPEDTDEFFAIEEKLGKTFIAVDGQLYAFWKLQDVDEDGFALVITPSAQTRFLAYWYNGGGSVQEVVEHMIRAEEAAALAAFVQEGAGE